MDINALKKMSYEEVRHLYMPFLQSQGVGPNTSIITVNASSYTIITAHKEK